MSETDLDRTITNPDTGAVAAPVARTALAGAQAESALWSLQELPFSSKINVRVNADTPAWRSLLDSLALTLPTANTCNSTDTLGVYWLGPDEFLLRGAYHAELVSRVQQALQHEHAAVVDVSDYYTVFRLAVASGEPTADAADDSADEFADNTAMRKHLDVYTDLVAKLSPLDTRVQKFGALSCAQTRMGDAAVLLSPCQPSHESTMPAAQSPAVDAARAGCDVQVRWSYAPYLWSLLGRAARLSTHN